MDLAYDASGTYIATGAADSTVRVWHAKKGFCTHNFKGHSGVVSLVRFHPEKDKWTLFSCGEDFAIRVWNLLDSSCRAVLENHMSVVTDLDFSPSGTTLYSGGRDAVLNVWNINDFTHTRTIPVFENLTAVVLLPATREVCEPFGVEKSGRRWPALLVTAGDKKALRVWNADSGDCVFTQEADNSAAPYYSAFMRGSTSQLVAVTIEGTFKFYDTRAGLSQDKVLVGYNEDVMDVKFLGKSDNDVAVATSSSELRLYKLDTGDCTLLGGHENLILSLSVSPDGVICATASKDNTVRVWHLPTHKCIGLCVGHTDAVTTVALGRRTPFLVSGSADRTLKLWDTKTLARDGSSEAEQRLHATTTQHVHDKDINSVDVTPNDQMIATGSLDKTVKLWSRDLTALATLKGHRRGVWSVRFSPVDKVVASSSADKTVKIWSVTDFTCLKTFEGHEASVLNVAFITHGMQIVASASDGLIKVFTIKTAECAATLDVHQDKVWAISAADDGATLVSGGADALITVWRDVTATKLEEEAARKEEIILREQELANCVRQKQYEKAILIALELQHPRRLLTVFEAMQEDVEHTESIENAVKRIHTEKLDLLLQYVRQWNTNAKNSLLAQRILHSVLRAHPPASLSALPNIKQTIEALLPYTDKHYQRLERLAQQSYLIDLTLASMDSLMPVAALAAPGDITTLDSRKRTRDDGVDGGDDVESSGEEDALLPAKRAFTNGTLAATMAARAADHEPHDVAGADSDQEEEEEEEDDDDVAPMLGVRRTRAGSSAASEEQDGDSDDETPVPPVVRAKSTGRKASGKATVSKAGQRKAPGPAAKGKGVVQKKRGRA